jgi:ABC-type multidrug transport system ATPase subunit
VGGECIAWGRGVWKSFGSTIVFADAEFCFRRGMNVLWAPNGSGKSTLIKLLLGILKPDRGVVWIDRRFKLGVLLEDHVALRGTLLLDLISYGVLVKGGGSLRVGEVVDLVGLRGELGKSVGELSAGNSKKALIAQALAGNPELLVLDEPLSNLDPASRIAISSVLNDLRDRGVSMIIATHILSVLNPDYMYTIANNKILGPHVLRRARRVRAINPKTGLEEEMDVNDAIKAYHEGWVVLDA